ncbi:hypothetical protein PHYSODRAFT_475291 [Phytophthora sojae]|uniref:Uncharacterized protein n=1 Tax=Phytophthora sojae (strain P6497) TaxID=1094619 RepID=G4YF59_PHYSP|nr:hypothetical protein PHYSODRAFT_475291 [Phytophthora sojae]EGZ27963.1 hypothetical protein PHYSODRAFT_475291 [Phytophthora sojae]|eukprot:XP_009515238.1 hypothetical protein PHYSODRAFT_475291 [Phytophthora sojae]
MHDPRIPRGSIFAPVNTARAVDARDKVKKRRGTTTKRRSNNNNKGNPSIFEAQAVPSYGCRLLDAFTSISLDANLIEQTQPTPERESFSQTDDCCTSIVVFPLLTPLWQFSSLQIEESDGLFNFDVEVKPLLNVLVNKTLAQALVEVKEEQEMQMLHRQHEVVKAEKRDARQAERDLEEKAKEANRKKELIKKKKAEKQIRDQIMRRKLFAWQFARPMVSQAIDQATTTLQKKGVFYDPMLRNLAIWLAGDVYQAADDTIRLRALSVELLDGMLYYCVYVAGLRMC